MDEKDNLIISPESALNPVPWGSMDLIKGGIGESIWEIIFKKRKEK